MGKLIVQQFVSADGYAADDSGEFDLFSTVEGDSAGFDRANAAWIDDVGAILIGRRTYQEFVTYWPTDAAKHEVVSDPINTLPRFVFSTTLTEAPWGEYEPATIESGDAADTVRRLKNAIDRDLIVWGSLSLTEALFRAAEVDVVRLVVLPVALGSGRGVFPPEGEPLRLKLESSATFDGELVELEYSVLH